MCFVLFLFCVFTCVCYAFKFKVHCGSAFEPGASGLPYHCTPPVCVPALLGALAVWRHNKKKQKKSKSLEEFGSPSFDLCGATFFAGLSAGRFAGLSSTSFSSAKSLAKGTELPSYVCMHARMKHITRIKRGIDTKMFFYVSEYIQF